MLAAAPAWFADNVVAIAVGTLLVLTFLVLRMIQKTMLRGILLAAIAAVALFVYANRVELEACARTCECRLLDQDVTVPACNTNLKL